MDVISFLLKNKVIVPKITVVRYEKQVSFYDALSFFKTPVSYANKVL